MDWGLKPDSVTPPPIPKHRETRKWVIIVGVVGSLIFGIAEVAREPYPDPQEKDPRRVVVDLKRRELLPQPVTLAEVKTRAEFRDFDLVRMGRLSAMPVSESR